jgi:hypothetical protein
VLRKLVTGLGVALAIFGGMAATAGLAQAADTRHSSVSAQSGTWVFVRWFQGDSMHAYWQCSQYAAQQYPGRDYNCRIEGGTTQLWVRY